LTGASGIHRGAVADYDGDAGYGTILDATGRPWWFHCTAIAGGERHIDVGAEVCFRLVPGRQGCREAVDLQPA
jgi:cold shock CspA family protein